MGGYCVAGRPLLAEVDSDGLQMALHAKEHKAIGCQDSTMPWKILEALKSTLATLEISRDV